MTQSQYLSFVFGLVASLGAKAFETPSTRVVQIAPGTNHTCALFDSGRVRCWGDNSFSQLGVDAEIYSSIGGSPGQMGSRLPEIKFAFDQSPVKSLVAGSHHTCALFKDNQVICWGANTFGQLGVPDAHGNFLNGVQNKAVNLGQGRYALAISAGDAHTCALLDDHQVKCWGSNWLGQLGLGDTRDRGLSAHDMGDELPTVNLGTDLRVESVVAGVASTCAILSNETLKCWGANPKGKLGLGDTKPRGTSPLHMGNALPAIDLGQGLTVAQVSVGNIHICALLRDATENMRLKCWGGNDQGQLGLGDHHLRGAKPGQMGDELPFVDLGADFKIARIDSGDFHMCAVSTAGDLKCWGWNAGASLGLGDVVGRGDHPGQMGDALPFVNVGTAAKVSQFKLSSWDSCAVLTTGAVKCWGGNLSGILGQGDEKTRGTSPYQMGDGLKPVDFTTEYPPIVPVDPPADHPFYKFRGRHDLVRIACKGIEGGQISPFCDSQVAKLYVNEIDIFQLEMRTDPDAIGHSFSRYWLRGENENGYQAEVSAVDGGAVFKKTQLKSGVAVNEISLTEDAKGIVLKIHRRFVDEEKARPEWYAEYRFKD